MDVQLVKNILSEDERARNDDKWLTYRVLRHFTNIFIPFADFSKMPAFDTIRRTRQKVQNEERVFLPTSQQVRERRRIRELDVRDWATRG